VHNLPKAGGEAMPNITLNGVDLFYTEQGSGDDTIVFAHGLLMDGSMWDFVAPSFVEKYRVIRFDFRGQGQSSNPGSGFEINTLVEDTAAFIQAVSTKPVHYVGLSMGGMVGMPLSARHPDLIRSLVLLDTSAQAEPWYKKIKYRLMSIVLVLFGVKPLVSSTMKLMFGHSTLRNSEKAELVAHWKQKISALKKTIVGPVMGVMMRPDISEELGKIYCPTLIVVGEEDTTTPMHCAHHMDALISDAELEIIPDCGHSSALEKSEHVIQLIKQFYARL
jgi:3-oxoadipate enol-lactonase